jgi:hypothetical protein
MTDLSIEAISKTSHFKKKILARNQGISELKTAGILEVVEDFQGGLTQSPGQKTFLRWLGEILDCRLFENVSK